MKTTTTGALVAAVIIAVAQTASGATWRLASNESSATTYSSLTNAYSWVSTSSSSTHSGNPGEPLSSTETYRIRGGYTAVTLSGDTEDTVFRGKSLQLGESTAEGRIRHLSYGAARTSWDDWGANNGLVLQCGHYLSYAGANLTNDIYGKVQVTASPSAPFVFASAYPNVQMNWYGDFRGNAGTQLRIEGVNYSSTSFSRVNGFQTCFHGSMEGYKGGIAVSNAVFATGTTSFPGTLSVEGDGRLTTIEADDVLTVNALALSPGASIVVNAQLGQDGTTLATNGLIVVTNEFSVTGKATVSIDGVDPSALSAAVCVPVLEVAASAEIYPEQFTMTAARFDVVTNDATGAKTLVAVVAPVVTQTAASAIIPSPDWSDEKAPHSGAHYQVNMLNNAETTLYTASDANLEYEFPGESLRLASSKSTLRLRSKSAYFKELRLSSGSYVLQHNCSGTLGGRIVMPDSNYASICVYNTLSLNIAADIVGSSRIVMDGYHSSTSGRSGYTELTGDNSRFFGTITVGQHRDPLTVADIKFQTLYVSDPAKLGAPLSAFNAKALVLKRLGRLRARGSVTLADTTRGVFIGTDGGPGSGGEAASKGTASEGQVYADADETLAILSQLTLNGRLHKYGAGTLALGGPLKFGNAESDEPLANSNLLAVAQGFVKPLAADSFNGMEMTFAAGTGIKLDIDPQDADLRTYGLRNTKAVTPFVAPASGKIPVSFDVPEGFRPQDQFQIGLATVPTAVAESVRGMLEVKRPKIRCALSISVVPDGDDATILATFKPVGFVVSFR